jgi:hypothetical protein
VWGKKRAEATNPLYVNTLDASKFVESTDEVTDSYFGGSIAGGDFNHDGISDLLIGAPYYSNYTQGAATLCGATTAHGQPQSTQRTQQAHQPRQNQTQQH